MAETRHGIPRDFLDAADAFVQLGNKYTDRHARAWICAVMMYSAARFNAFAWLTREDKPEQTVDQAVAYYRSEYEKMLLDNLDELAPHYSAGAKAQDR